MRWESQRAGTDAQQALIGLDGLVRSVRAPEFAGLTFHEVRARSVLNRVPGGSRVPFRWTVNPYRGCSHACTYCFARNTHTYLDFDAGRDFDTQVVVKINAPEVLAAQLHRPGWTREHVAMGTNTDPYQRAEGRYRLMPGIIRAFAGSGTPFSVLTKGTTLARDLPLLRSVSAEVDVGLGVSIAVLDRALQHRLEPGTPSPKARLELVRRIRDAGLDCSVMVAPVLPGLTDSSGQLDELLAAIAAAGATGATVLALHLRPGAREWYGRWLAREHPELVPRYRELYAGGSYAGGRYRRTLAARVAPLLRRHGLGGHTGSAHRPPAGSGAAVPVPPPAAGQLTLL
ncbi:Rv2578c family radical SAM protein [Amycolatopsis cynarae]|uniref:Rv2578c family radical SAM protein n=1 Tax=Amycolatopsis cynarae TaxID=2995223 RepID=A0ABY7AT47_9PSEU|nr:Rv2578c family radical SAM protein [Amycolatopsis sp. HUAS 11-8]WAL63130.1 Rv2578c family radical SAM protein [Amycolatopsis sp. HUAS 11-8]